MPLSTDDIRKFVVTELSVFLLRNKPQTWDFALRSLDYVAKDIDDPARMEFVQAMEYEGLIVIDKSEPFHTGPIHHLCRVTDEHADHLKTVGIVKNDAIVLTKRGKEKLGDAGLLNGWLAGQWNKGDVDDALFDKLFGLNRD